MAASHNDDVERVVLRRLYGFAQDHPTAYKRLRIDNDEYSEQAVADILDDLFDRQLLQGNLEERNVQLSSDGIEYVEEHFPEIAEKAG